MKKISKNANFVAENPLESRMNTATVEFITAHDGEDTAALALKYRGVEGVDLSLALRCIKIREKIRRKLPSWHELPQLVYPSSLSAEQCSSEAAAEYKQEVAQNLLSDDTRSTYFEKKPKLVGRITDLTAGLGVDTLALSKITSNLVCFEMESEYAEALEHNMSLFGVGNVTVRCEKVDEKFFDLHPENSDLIYIDPARRDSSGSKVYSFRDCSPDVTSLLPKALDHCLYMIIKASPMADISECLKSLSENSVKEVHVVEWAGECRELLFVLYGTLGGKLSIPSSGDPMIHLINLDYDMSVYPRMMETRSAEAAARQLQSFINPSEINTCKYLAEPSPSVMKAGCLSMLSLIFDCRAISSQSHLFLGSSEEFINEFPGRRFCIEKAVPFSKKGMAELKSECRAAGVKARNFPMTSEQVRKLLSIKDSSEHHIFATTLSDGSLYLFLCKKL